MPKVTQTLGNNKARACESLGFAHKKGCASILTQPLSYRVHITLVMQSNSIMTSRSICHSETLEDFFCDYRRGDSSSLGSPDYTIILKSKDVLSEANDRDYHILKLIVMI